MVGLMKKVANVALEGPFRFPPIKAVWKEPVTADLEVSGLTVLPSKSSQPTVTGSFLKLAPMSTPPK